MIEEFAEGVHQPQQNGVAMGAASP
jgi:hypothetical protein